jgi:hypothetical protein
MGMRGLCNRPPTVAFGLLSEWSMTDALRIDRAVQTIESNGVNNFPPSKQWFCFVLSVPRCSILAMACVEMFRFIPEDSGFCDKSTVISKRSTIELQVFKNVPFEFK